jgi:hypothetical protein
VEGYPFRLSLLGCSVSHQRAYRMVNERKPSAKTTGPPVPLRDDPDRSHDVPRALTVLSGHPDPRPRPQAAGRLTPENGSGAWTGEVAAAFQVVIRCSSVYDGDEPG